MENPSFTTEGCARGFVLGSNTGMFWARQGVWVCKGLWERSPRGPGKTQWDQLGFLTVIIAHGRPGLSEPTPSHKHCLIAWFGLVNRAEVRDVYFSLKGQNAIRGDATCREELPQKMCWLATFIRPKHVSGNFCRVSEPRMLHSKLLILPTLPGLSGCLHELMQDVGEQAFQFSLCHVGMDLKQASSSRVSVYLSEKWGCVVWAIGLLWWVNLMIDTKVPGRSLEHSKCSVNIKMLVNYKIL